ncbi:hypothetical protein CA51_26740 [Rosistilla oblonga]|uniref:hypothetical protein n=1 Tax=Rosistilla oblonga TaxID=2527990 RepID=UPI0011885DD0|nr:hypothetical protein [Rosistilla oblonga]QDV12788.1 hypothetical protein CA51_26740 [Rosistilla oblonga]
MRIKRRVNTPFSFNTRTLFAIVTVSAIGMWLGVFALLVAIGITAIHYLVLSAFALLLARTNGQPKPPYHRWRLVTADNGDTIRTCTTTFLIFFAVWHLFWLLVLLPPGFPQLWDSQIHGLCTLAQLEHTVAAAFALLLVTSFLTNIFAGTPFSHRICIDTSTLLTLLSATHFVIP